MVKFFCIFVRWLRIKKMKQTVFRPASCQDTERVWQIVVEAIHRLGVAGVDQWQHGYPNQARIEEDIADGIGYVMECKGKVVAYGAVLFTGEPAYAEIEGSWLTEGEDYVVLHRMCVADEVVGQGFGRRFMEEVEALARGRVSSFRIDTHADNPIMHRLVGELGFQRCGVIYFESRYLVAYEKVLTSVENASLL